MAPKAHDTLAGLDSTAVPPGSAAPFGSGITRPRLLKLLDQYAVSPITLVVAPAGSGKSTLVAQWVENVPHPVAWIALSGSVNSTSVLCATISRALAAPSPLSSIDALLAYLREQTSDGTPITLIFDDYHVVENRDVHDAMDGLLARLSDPVRIVLISRTHLPLSLSRLRAEGYVRELTQQDLGFTPDEVASVVGRIVPDTLTPDQIQDLAQRTEGWIAGLRLALLSLDHVAPESIPSVLDSWTAHRWLDDYIVGEVLNRLPAEILGFVLRTSMLTWLEPALCNYVLEIETSASLIQAVGDRLVFVRPYGSTVSALTYHGLFAESVTRIAERQLNQSELQRLRRRAAEWFEEHGQFEAAIDHAVATEDWETAVRCVRVIGRALMDSDHHHSRLHVLSKLPEKVRIDDPHLARWYISALCYTGQMRLVRELFAQVEPIWTGSGDPVQLGYVASTRAFFQILEGNIGLTLRHAYDGLHHYPHECHVERLHLWNAVAQWEFVFGNDDVSEQAYHQAEACRAHLPEEQWWWTMMTEVDRANRQAVRGDLRTAEAMYRQGLDQLSAIYRSHEAKIRFRLAAIYLEWNDLDKAAAEVERIESDLSTFPQQLWHAEAHQVVAQVHTAMGNTRSLQATMDRLRQMYEVAGGGSLPKGLEALQVTTWLAEGSVGLAREWAALHRIEEYSGVHTFGHPDPRLALLQSMIAGGDFARANEQLGEPIVQARDARHWAELIPLLMWQAVVRHELGDDDGAVHSLADAVKHGQQGRFVRSFLTPGYDLTPIFRRVRTQLTADEASHLDLLLDNDSVRQDAAASHDVVTGEQLVTPLVEHDALTRREREVAALLVHGLTNSEIALRLFITKRTAQKHVINILAKLSVPNRRAAGRLLRDRIDPTP